MYRAMESERSDALFHDTYARRLAGPTGEQILASMPQGRRWAWPMIEIIMRVVRDEGLDTIVNLAAGLDARPYRLDLPPQLHWIDVDLEGILSYKEAALASERPRCRVEFVRADLTDHTARRALFQRVGAEAKRALVISEGLLVYLTPEDVTSLAQDLSAQPALRWWLIDLGGSRPRRAPRSLGPPDGARRSTAPFSTKRCDSTARRRWRGFGGFWDCSRRRSGASSSSDSPGLCCSKTIRDGRDQ